MSSSSAPLCSNDDCSGIRAGRGRNRCEPLISGGYSNLCYECKNYTRVRSPSPPRVQLSVTFRGYPVGFNPSPFMQVPVGPFLSSPIAFPICQHGYIRSECPFEAQVRYG